MGCVFDYQNFLFDELVCIISAVTLLTLSLFTMVDIELPPNAHAVGIEVNDSL